MIADTYFLIWSVLCVGIGIGMLFSSMLAPAAPRWFGAVSFVLFVGLGILIRWYGPSLLLIEVAP